MDGVLPGIGDGLGTAAVEVVTGIGLGDGQRDVAVTTVAVVDDGGAVDVAGDADGTDVHEMATEEASRASTKSCDKNAPPRTTPFTALRVLRRNQPRKCQSA